MRHQPQSDLSSGCIWDANGGATLVPVQGFDFDSVYRHLDGEAVEVASTPRKALLSEILSPGELKHALKVAQLMLRGSSSKSIATKLSWLNPEVRARRIAGLKRATNHPDWRRKRSAIMRRVCQFRDLKKWRECCLKLWRERREEMLAKQKLAMSKPEFRRRKSITSHAMWDNPAVREKILSKLRSPEARQNAALKTRQYFQNHPEARVRAARIARLYWLDPEYRLKRARALSAKYINN
jgi:hypothetical protein